MKSVFAPVKNRKERTSTGDGSLYPLSTSTYSSTRQSPFLTYGWLLLLRWLHTPQDVLETSPPSRPLLLERTGHHPLLFSNSVWAFLIIFIFSYPSSQQRRKYAGVYSFSYHSHKGKVFAALRPIFTEPLPY